MMFSPCVVGAVPFGALVCILLCEGCGTAGALLEIVILHPYAFISRVLPRIFSTI